MTESSFTYTSALDPQEERDRIIMEELPQVHYIARRIHERLPQHIPFEDLVNAGVLGLIEAVHSYDRSKQIQLKTFAQFRIRGAILDSLRELDWGSRKLRRKGRAVEEAVTRLAGRFGRRPTEQEIANELGISLADLYQLLAKLDGLDLVGQQTDSAYDHSETKDLIDSAPSSDENPFERYVRTEAREKIAGAIASLSKKEQMVVSLYYYDELTMKEVAAVLEVTESRVSQIHSVAMLKLRAALGKNPTRPLPVSRETVGGSQAYAKLPAAAAY